VSMKEFRDFHFDKKEFKKALEIPDECQITKITMVDNERIVVVKGMIFRDK